MMQKRSHVQDAQKSRRNLERENEGQRYRYLTDLPDFSNVMENSQSMRHLGSSEISLLDKIGQTERISDSTLFMENREKSFDGKIVEEVRFSFNNLDKKGQEQRAANQGSLTERYRQEYAKAAVEIANQDNQIDRAKQKNFDIEKIKNKYLGNQQKEERNFLKKVEVQQKYESKIFHDLDSFSKENFSKKLEESEQLVASKNVDKIFQKVLLDKPKAQTSQRYDILPISKQPSHSGLKEQIGHEEELKTIKSLQKIAANSHVELRPVDHHCLEALFDSLDRTKTGKIDKQNCNIDNIKEQFHLIFGVIFYRIKFNLEGFNKKQFVGLCYDCLKLLSKETLVKVTSLLQQNSEALKSANKQRQEKESFLSELIEKEKAEKEQLLNEIALKEKQEKERQAKDKAQRQKIIKERQEREKALKQIEAEQARGKQESLNILKEREERERQLKIYQQKYRALKAQENMMHQKKQQEGRCQNCKSLTKQKPSESPPKEKALLTSRQSNQTNQLNSKNHSKVTYAASKEVNQENNIKNKDQSKQSQKIQIKILKEKENLAYKYKIDESKIEESMKQSALKDRKNDNPKREKTKNQPINKAKAQPPKKKRNISEEILREHKRSLQELHELNNKVDQYISHVPEIEQLAELMPTIQTHAKLTRNYQTSYRQGLNNI